MVELALLKRYLAHPALLVNMNTPPVKQQTTQMKQLTEEQKKEFAAKQADVNKIVAEQNAKHAKNILAESASREKPMTLSGFGGIPASTK